MHSTGMCVRVCAHPCVYVCVPKQRTVFLGTWTASIGVASACAPVRSKSTRIRTATCPIALPAACPGTHFPPTMQCKRLPRFACQRRLPPRRPASVSKSLNACTFVPRQITHANHFVRFLPKLSNSRKLLSGRVDNVVGDGRKEENKNDLCRALPHHSTQMDAKQNVRLAASPNCYVTNQTLTSQVKVITLGMAVNTQIALPVAPPLNNNANKPPCRANPRHQC